MEHIFNCQTNVWYKSFRRSTIRCKFINIPEDFIHWMQIDGLILPRIPEGVTPSRIDPRSERKTSDEFEEEYESLAEEPNHFCFPEFEEEINKAIEQLGGQCFPKLNWSSPKDAAWVNGGSLCCRSSGEIFLLLKSSNFVFHDLEQSPPQLVLTLKSWCNLQPEMEFRCFVFQQKLIGISQRECSCKYDYLLESKARLQNLISDFFRNSIQNVFPDPHYVFDVYIDKIGKVWLLDFNPFTSTTDSLLFLWEELNFPNTNSTIENLTLTDNETKDLSAKDVKFEQSNRDCNGIAATKDRDSDLVSNVISSNFEFRIVDSEIPLQATSTQIYGFPSDIQCFDANELIKVAREAMENFD